MRINENNEKAQSELELCRPKFEAGTSEIRFMRANYSIMVLGWNYYNADTKYYS
jgi:hypothetical protein